MHIGLIGGIGPAATDFYYRGLIDRASKLGRELELTIVHADTSTLLHNLFADNRDEQIAIYDRLTRRLVASGADCVVVTSIAGHFCIDGFAAVSTLPVIDITKSLSSWLGHAGVNKVGIIGTDKVMTSGMYGKLKPVEVIPPERNEIAEVHNAYVTLAQTGTTTVELTTVFLREGIKQIENGAEAVLLGGTDLNLAAADMSKAFPIVDCASIHIDEIARWI